ncbi:hypothetical protein NC652_014773 [Populus alba x Populus x berolinensis]|nr:hypothetical protein NC652_014773 [Populus alba x Populus x berolinensis]
MTLSTRTLFLKHPRGGFLLAWGQKTQNEQQLVCFLARFQVCMAVIIAIFTSTRKRLNSEHHASLPQLEGCHLFLPQLEEDTFHTSFAGIAHSGNGIKLINQTIRRTEMDIVCVARGCPEILSTSNTTMAFMLWSHLRLSLLAHITSWEISNHNKLDATIYYMGSVQ